MRYGLIADIHGRRNHLELVLEHINTFSDIDEIICLGDVFEVKVSKKQLPNFVFHDIEQVIDIDLKLLELLSGYQLVRGNQEERVLHLVPREKIPAELHPFFLNLPSDIDLPEMARITHGHNFNWVDYPGGYWHPVITKWERPWLFYGHNHQNALFLVREKNGSWYYDRQEIVIGKPLELDPKSCFLINVGDIKRPTPSWVLYDNEEGTVTFYTLARLNNIKGVEE